MISIAYLAFFLATFPFAIARNRLFGFYYAALYIYSAFSIAGYLYVPGLSESLGAYFGDDVGRSALLFAFLSLALFWVVNMWIYRPRRDARPIVLVDHASAISTFGVVTYAVIGLFFAGLLAANFSALSWYLFEQTDTLPLTTVIFLALYKTMVGVLLIGYVVARSRDIHTPKTFVILYAMVFAAFLVASIRLGNRTDPVAVVAGVLMYEVSVRQFTIRSIAGLGLGMVIAVSGISAIEYFRYLDGGIQLPLMERIVQNDYFAPAHMLIAAVAFDYVDPGAVLRSNTANALILLGEPYLQQTVTELFRANVATRSAGYAFYIMAEGWIFLGWGGVLYNALVPSAGLWVWNRLASTDSRLVNIFLQVLVASMLLNVTRGQSSYFIKYFYTFFIPNILIFMIVAGVRLRLNSRERQPATA